MEEASKLETSRKRKIYQILPVPPVGAERRSRYRGPVGHNDRTGVK